MKASPASRFVVPLLVVMSLMFIWNLSRNLNDVLIPHLKRACQLTNLQSSLVQSAFFGAYFLLALPVGQYIRRFGYRMGMITGLLTAATGALLFFPAAETRYFPLFLLALFVLATGFTFLEVTVTPYISILGTPERASSRLSLAAAVGSLGAMLGPFIGAMFLLHAQDVPESVIQQYPPDQLVSFLNAEARLVKGPYLGLSAALVMLAVAILFVKLPTISENNESLVRLTGIFRFRHTMLGALGVVCYLGAEVGIVSFLIRYVKAQQLPGLTEQKAALFISLFMGLVLVGRLTGAWLLRRIQPVRLLTGCAVGAAVLVVSAVLTTGYVSVYCLTAVGLCTSVMYPILFTLSIKGLGNYIKTGSSLLIMSIGIGAALVPPLMGLVVDTYGLRPAFGIPVLCYGYIILYSIGGHLNRPTRSVNPSKPMMTKLICILLLSGPAVWAQPTIGGGELNPGLYTNQQARKRFQDARIGISIHWGPSSISGQEISWSRGEQVPKAEYDELYKRFNPTRYNADEWAELIKSFGARYVLFTSKHHDGFSMWHSNFSPYTIKETPFKRDILKELSEACQKKDILFGTYYSSLDWYHPDYQPYGRGGPGALFPTHEDTPNQQRYWIYMKNQLRELITDYKSKIIQFDGDWDTTWTHAIGADTYLYIRKLNDEVLVNNRTDKGRYIAPNQKETGVWNAPVYAGDFEDRERLTTNLSSEESKVFGKSPYPWQAWVTLDKSQWSWKKNFKFMSHQDIIVDLLKTLGDGGNYLINIGPKSDGTFESDAVRTMQQVGRWLTEHESMIYGTQGGPFVAETKYTSTRKGKQINLFVFDKTAKLLTLDAKHLKIISIVRANHKPISFRQTGELVTFSAEPVDGFVSVYKIITQ